MQLLSWAKGKKTYLAVAAGVALGVADAFGYHVALPHWLQWIAGSTVLGFLRSGITNEVESRTSTAVADLLTWWRTVMPLVVDSSNENALRQLPNLVSLPSGAIVPTGKDNIIIGRPTPKDIPEVQATQALNRASLNQQGPQAK